MKRTCASLPSATLFVVFPIAPLLADTSDGTETMWVCPHADGRTVYTNTEHTGCQAMALKPLSSVPDLIPTMMPRAMPGTTPHRDRVPFQDRAPGMGTRTIPDGARDWYTGIAPSGSGQEEVCSLYSEWIQLVQKTRGGVFFGSDPSYGGDLTGRPQRGPSYSYDDNARYRSLSKLFGRGFVPIGCS